MFAIKTGVVCLGVLGAASMLPAQDLVISGIFPAPVTPQVAAQVPQRAKQAAFFHTAGSYLGVGLVEVTEDRARALNLKDTHGVEIRQVDENSPAAKAGLKENDVVLDYNGQRIEGVEQFIRMIGETPFGRKVNMTVWRNGSPQTVSATLDSRPRNMVIAPMPPNVPMPPMPEMEPNFGDLERRLGELDSRFPMMMNSVRVGIEGESLTPQLAEYFGVKRGVLVRTVNAKTPAEKAGLKAGDVITKVGGTPVMSPREITGAVRSGKGKIPFTVVRNKKEIMVDVELPERRTPAGDRDLLE
jgi:serine protease Do